MEVQAGKKQRRSECRCRSEHRDQFQSALINLNYSLPVISITFALATLVAFVHVRQAHMLFNVIALLFIGAAVERQGVAKRIKNGVARMKIIATPARTKMSDETAIGA